MSHELHEMYRATPLKSTTWINPSKHVIRFPVWVGKKRQIVVFEPGETKDLPSEYDRVIQVVRNGRIEGGRAPQLQRVGAKKLPIAPALDSEAEAKKSSLDKIGKALALKETADALLDEAAAREAAATEEIEEAGDGGETKSGRKPKGLGDDEAGEPYKSSGSKPKGVK